MRNRLDMAGKRDSKGKAPMRSVSIADGDYSPRSQPASPGPSNTGRNATRQPSPEPSHDDSAAAQAQPRSRPEGNQSSATTTSAPSTSTTAAATPAQPIAANRYSTFPSVAAHTYGNWRPYVTYPGYGYGQGYPQAGFGMPPFPPVVNQFGQVVSPFSMAAQQQPDPPAPVNPPDELGPPPPPPPPPAIPPVLNPFGVHFQPQVPGTEMGPMTHHYIPRHDQMGAPGMLYPGQQMTGYMVSALVGLVVVVGQWDRVVLLVSSAGWLRAI